MMFAKPLRAGVMSGEITESLRIWQRPQVKVGGRYAMVGGPGFIEITHMTEIDLADADDAMARRGGFKDLDDLLATARHGRGERVFVVQFRYAGPGD
jgi:hypothetical protein